VPEGRYEFRVFPVAAAAAQDGAEAPIVTDSFRFLDHKFPVRGKHDFGSEIAKFGAGRPATHTRATTSSPPAARRWSPPAAGSCGGRSPTPAPATT
jgi:hypothetical protein